MPFRIPKPQYDENLVLAIEDHLNQNYLTEMVMVGQAVDGLRTTYHVGGGASDGTVYKQPLLKIVADHGTYPTTPWRGRGCDMCDNWAYTHQCHLHETTGPLPLRTADQRKCDLTFDDALRVFGARLGPERESTDFYEQTTEERVQRARDIAFGSDWELRTHQGTRQGTGGHLRLIEEREYTANEELHYSMEIQTAPELTEVQSLRVTYRDIEESVIEMYWGGRA